ncbi:MAG: deoxyribose-phosphate aldolase [Pseudomonadota bacterium]
MRNSECGVRNVDKRVHRIAPYIDHTLLKSTTTEAEICKLCDEALQYGFASVCVPPCYVNAAANGKKNLTVGTVIGFPLGYNTSAVKVKEALTAREDGASEVDMVINRGWIKDRNYLRVVQEVQSVVQAVPELVIKVILELCELTLEEKRETARALLESGAHFLKTSTGFGRCGAAIEDVRLLSGIAGGRMKVKAAGGIMHAEEALALIAAGASRIGTSSGVQMVREELSAS